MRPDFRRLMDEATRLTRSGDLNAATATIQAALGARPAVAPTGAHPARAPARRLPAAAPLADAPLADAPTRGRFVAGTHAEAAGEREFKLYVPPQAGEHPLPLIVMLHGCTQDPDDFAAGTAMNEAAFEQGFFVLYPAQSRRMNPQGCWNWFKRNHQQRSRGEPAILAGMTRETMIRHAVDARRVYVAGLSAGGAMAAILGVAYPDLYAAVGVHSGLAAGAASDLASALEAMRGGGPIARAPGNGVPTIVFHGDADTKVHPRNGEQIIAASVGATAEVETQSVHGNGRASTRYVHRSTDGLVLAEHWVVHGAAHAWSGGSPAGSHTDARGPDASAQMLRFFFEHPLRAAH